MMHFTKVKVFALIAVSALVIAGCTQILAYMTEERGGNVTIVVVNNTNYRASFTLGSYDAFDLNPPGPIVIEQHRYEANTTNTFTVACRRNIAIGTQNMVDRALDTKQDQTTGFDADAFGPDVNFSSAPADSAAAALPTEGTAAGREVMLGVDFACKDQLIFTFVADATAPGGFRIDYDLLHTQEPN